MTMPLCISLSPRLLRLLPAGLALAIASGAWLGAGLWAQVPEEELVEFSFQTYFYTGSEADTASVPRGENALYYQQGAEFKPLTLAPNNLGLKHTFRGSLPFRLYVQQTNEDGQTVYRPVAEAVGKNAGEGSHRVLFIQPAGEQFRIALMRADAARVAQGEVLIMNVGGQALAATSGEGTLVQIGPGESKVMRYDEGEDSSFSLKIASRKGEGWDIIHTSRLAYRNPRPLFLIVYPTQDGKFWHVRFLKLRQ
ncbi:hypothetical protein H5P28_15025 [Ruficoccus amylovorans]|uniref:Uncharacterized protein n=1 Tax=Ruficoccus amylovorans TaxID=1804625 RepID=A0A842HHV4_9BACT|nr:hypothetical protein [Ruficoccus amylovorans]MBC2595578.1 hypothetical protein [Ruficoccus amylovorans]